MTLHAYLTSLYKQIAKRVQNEVKSNLKALWNVLSILCVRTSDVGLGFHVVNRLQIPTMGIAK